LELPIVDSVLSPPSILSARWLAELGHLLREAARSEIIPRFRNLAANEVRTKSGPLDLVTEADEAAERAIEAGLARLLPGAVVVGEEAATADPSLLRAVATAEWAVAVDPVDGTANFAAGVPLFGVMAAVVHRGEVVAAAIHDPMGDDTALALRGEGAWIEAPGGRRNDLRVASAPADVGAMTGAVSWRYLPMAERQVVCANMPRFASIWDYRCAAHHYRVAAAGDCHFLFWNRLLPWDHAPGWLLHREAGGYSARFDGSPYCPADTAGGLICAPDLASWQAVREALLGTPAA
jgi:fructose-1,6-bisphosphatase/inositol monophosphatase family enzyme